ncbi:F-box protein At2g05970-like [Carex rostrata]
MGDSASEFPDWAHLLPEVVYLISEKVKYIADYIRFRAVCSPWRSASAPKPRHLPHQLPWLMIPYGIRRTDDDGIRLFYDLWESKMRKIHLPETIGKLCWATYRGWLLIVASDCRELFLLNPLTRTRVKLPKFRNWMDFSRSTKMTFSADLTDPNCFIMLFLPYYNGIYFCKAGDLFWTDAVPHQVRREAVPLSVQQLRLKDATYNKGSFYLLYDQAMFVYDLYQQRVQGTYIFKPELQLVTKFFLKGKSGLYIVANYFTGRFEGALRQKIELYEIQEQQQMEIKQIADTSDITIFHGYKYQYLAVRTTDWDSLDGDCMYMAYVRQPSAGIDDGGSYSIYCAKLDDGEPKPVVLRLCEEMLNWLSLRAMWFQPNFV